MDFHQQSGREYPPSGRYGGSLTSAGGGAGASCDDTRRRSHFAFQQLDMKWRCGVEPRCGRLLHRSSHVASSDGSEVLFVQPPVAAGQLT